jgi:hypothetical protein
VSPAILKDEVTVLTVRILFDGVPEGEREASDLLDIDDVIRSTIRIRCVLVWRRWRDSVAVSGYSVRRQEIDRLSRRHL